MCFHEKRILNHRASGAFAIAEVRIWEIPRSKHYPEGIKYALFLVQAGRVLVGFDNHKPKGPHLHLGAEELRYEFLGVDKLIEDFWSFAKKAGYEI